MKNRKGFTLVELVIVIAVIAILAAVLIPTFGGIIEKANQNAAMQEARNVYTMYLSEAAEKDTAVETDVYVLTSKNYYVLIDGGQVKEQNIGTAEKPENVWGVKTKPANAANTALEGYSNIFKVN